jgi:hypothetical protein
LYLRKAEKRQDLPKEEHTKALCTELSDLMLNHFGRFYVEPIDFEEILPSLQEHYSY